MIIKHRSKKHSTKHHHSSHKISTDEVIASTAALSTLVLTARWITGHGDWWIAAPSLALGLSLAALLLLPRKPGTQSRGSTIMRPVAQAKERVVKLEDLAKQWGGGGPGSAGGGRTSASTRVTPSQRTRARLSRAMDLADDLGWGAELRTALADLDEDLLTQ